MAWVRGIREVRQVMVEAQPEVAGLRQGPVVMKATRVITELPAETWARLMHFQVSLPLATGAGPCGTSIAGHAGAVSVLAWSIAQLVEPLAAYYATYEPPMRFEGGPRGRRTP